jgi:hypothetical protein
VFEESIVDVDAAAVTSTTYNLPFNTADPGAAPYRGVTPDGTCGPDVGYSCPPGNSGWGSCCR